MTFPALLDDEQDETAPKTDGISRPSSPKLVKPESLGFLLDESDEGKVYRAIAREWKDDEIQRRNRVQRRKRNKWWRQGKRFARLEDKIEDKGLIKATLPPGMSSQPPMPNKVDDLCRKIVAQLTVDPPAPEVEPETDSDEDRGAAEFATRFLKSDGGEAGTRDSELVRRAIDMGTTAGSAFILSYVDPNGSGWRPEEIKAHPQAVDVNAPLIDPATGMPGTEFVTRYVGQDGQSIVDDPEQANRQWLPKLKAEIIPPERACFVPNTVTEPDEAIGTVFLMYDTLGDLRGRYETPEEPWGDDFVKDLLLWKPDKLKELLPPSVFRATEDREKKIEKDDKPSDTAIVFYFLAFRRSTRQYPDGAEIAVSGGGDGHVLFREPLPKQGKRLEVIDPPYVHIQQLADVDGDVMGQAIIEKFGAADEQRAMVLSAWNEFLDIHLHPNTFLTVTTPVQPKQLALRDGTPITVLSKDDMPFYEPERTFPPDAKEFLDRITEDMNNASGLQDAAQGVDSPNVQSGIHARQVIEQSLVSLGELSQNATNGIRRFWRQKLQLARAKMTIPQLMGYVGDDGSYKQEYWTGADFTGSRDVSIARGSGTMMSPSQKQEWITGMLNNPNFPLIDPQEAKDAIRSGIQATAGLQDDPHLMRIKRQVAQWSEGPPEGFTPAMPAVDQMTGQPAVDPMGQPVMNPPSFSPFDPRPNDEEPAVAAIRHRELTKFMAGSQYAKQPPEWRTVLDSEYQRMAYSAGVQTMRQQAQAQQQAAAQQQAQAAQQQAGQSADADKQRAHEAGQNDAQRQLETQKMDTKAALDAQKNAIAIGRAGTPQQAR